MTGAKQQMKKLAEYGQDALRVFEQLGKALSWDADESNSTKAYPLLPLSDRESKTKDEDRHSPYYARGRGDEFNFFARRLVGKPRTLSILTGPPGTGKTTLLHQIMAYAQRLGHVVVEIDPKDLGEPAKIVQRCRAAVVTAKDTPAHVTHATSCGFDGALRTEAEALIAKLDGELQAHIQNTTTRQNIGSINLVEHLEAVCKYQGKNHRILLVCDELQRVEEHIRKNSLQQSEVTNTLGILHDQLLPSRANLPVTTILAGLDNAPSILDRIISRQASASDLQLTGIKPYNCYEIIHDYLSIPELRKMPTTFYPPEKLAEWANKCDGHPLFATHTGFILQNYARERLAHGLTETIDPTQTITIEGLIQEQRENVYKQRLKITTGRNDLLHLTHALRLAAERNYWVDPQTEHKIQQPLTRGKVNLILLQVLGQVEGHPLTTGKERDAARHSVLGPLQQSGVLRIMETVPAFIRAQLANAHDRVVFPVPTITAAIAQLWDNDEDLPTTAISQCVDEAMADYTAKYSTRWTWYPDIKRDPIPILTDKDFQYEPAPEIPVTPLPGDPDAVIHENHQGLPQHPPVTPQQVQQLQNQRHRKRQ